MDQQQTNPSDLQPVEKKPWSAPKLSRLNLGETQSGGVSTGPDGSAYTSA